MRILVIALFLTLSACSTGTTEKKSAPGEIAESAVKKGVWFLEPADGATLGLPVNIKMQVSGMDIEPAGMVNEGKGHHHLIIDGNFIEEGIVVPADSTHIHYGKGQTEVELDLTPGQHTLTLQFADGVHTSYGKEWSSTISITVTETETVTNQ